MSEPKCVNVQESPDDVIAVCQPAPEWGETWPRFRQPEPAPRDCTCHPDDHPPVPCAQRYAASECFAASPLNKLAAECHAANQTWWHDPRTGQRIERNKGELICLMHSELSEAMEGERKNLMDDKLPHRRMAEVELADVLIRLFDYAGAFGYDLDGAVAEKRAYNAQRADHKPAARLAEGGKQW